MKKALAFNPYISHKSSLAEIEEELEFLLDYAENELDWNISHSEEQKLMSLTKLAKALGSKRKW